MGVRASSITEMEKLDMPLYLSLRYYRVFIYGHKAVAHRATRQAAR
jgi:hypothetical protein